MTDSRNKSAELTNDTSQAADRNQVDTVAVFSAGRVISVLPLTTVECMITKTAEEADTPMHVDAMTEWLPE